MLLKNNKNNKNQVNLLPKACAQTDRASHRQSEFLPEL